MNSELLYITKKLGYPSSFGLRSGIGDFLEQYPDGIYAENGGGAPMGWESAAVWFGGDSERAASRFERMMSERNELSRIFRTRVSGVLVLTFIYRLKSRMVTAIPIIGWQPQPIDPTWLYFTIPQGGTVSLTKNGTPTEVTLEYSLDNGSTWTTWVESENVRSLTLAAGQTMHVRNTSETSTGFSTGSNNYYNFAFTADTYAGGNTNSLLCKIPENVVIVNSCYYGLFLDCVFLLTPPQLPSTIIATGCYRSMFQNCLNLAISPQLPALTMKVDCYVNMFYQCSSLTTPPQLPATELANFCYQSMFQKCSSLTTPPQLPATELANFCYQSMFQKCSSLTTPPQLPATELANSCYRNMFSACSSLIIPVDFILPATILASNCYYSMFSNCTKVNLMRTNMTDISASNSLFEWLATVSPTGDFYCPAELTIPTGVSGIPSGWTRHDI